LTVFREISYDLKDLEIYNHFISGVKDLERYGNVKENHKKLTKLIDNNERKKSDKNQDSEMIISELDNKQKQMIESAKTILIINELLYSRNSSEITEELLHSAIALERRVQSFFTFEYIQAMNEVAEVTEKKLLARDEEAELNFIKSMTSMFLNIILYCAENLGNIKNYSLLKNLKIEDSNYSSVLNFLFGLKNSEEDVKINIEEIKKMLKKFDKEKNYILKGLVLSILDYELNYVGLSPKKITELSLILKLPQKDYKKLLAKSASE